MQNQATKRRFRLLGSRLKRQETSSSTTTAATSSDDNQASHDVDNDYNDRQRVEKRYKQAADELREAIQIRKGSWGSFDFEELANEPEAVDDSQFKNKINAALLSRESSIKDSEGWSKFTYAVECVFTALSPPVKNFLLSINSTQSVLPWYFN
jgi:hypothetical protein